MNQVHNIITAVGVIRGRKLTNLSRKTVRQQKSNFKLTISIITEQAHTISRQLISISLNIVVRTTAGSNVVTDKQPAKT